MLSKTAIAAYTSLTLLPVLIEAFLRRYQNKTRAISNNDDCYYKCFFTTVSNWQCRQHIYDKLSCGATCSHVLLKDIIEFVLSATESVSLCMYLLTSYEICNALLYCHKQGKEVRVIADERMCGCSGSQARILQRHGVPVKTQKSDGSMMHHKFFLIDENTLKPKLFIGTVNLTLQGLCSNWDTFVYTNNKKVIGRLKEEFEELWSDFCVYKRSYKA